MTKRSVLLAIVVTAVFALGTLTGVVVGAGNQPSPLPVLFDPEVFDGKGLEAIPPWPAEMVLSGESKHISATLFQGEIVAVVYESAAVKLALKNHPFDEFVHIESGKLVLTPEGAEAQTFEKGDSFVVPRGFTGTWDMSDGYREFVIVETKAMEAAMQPGGVMEIYREAK